MRAIGASGAAAFGPGSTHSHLGATFSPPREARRKGVECRPVITERPRQAAISLPTRVVKPPRRPHPGAPHRVTLLRAFSAGGCSPGLHLHSTLARTFSAGGIFQPSTRGAGTRAPVSRGSSLTRASPAIIPTLHVLEISPRTLPARTRITSLTVAVHPDPPADVLSCHLAHYSFSDKNLSSRRRR